MPRKAQKIYLFDLEGVCIATYPGAAECAQHTGATWYAVRAAANRGSVLLSRYYVSHTSTFVRPARQLNRNLLRGTAACRDGVSARMPRLEAVLLDEHELHMELTSSYLLG